MPSTVSCFVCTANVDKRKLSTNLATPTYRHLKNTLCETLKIGNEHTECRVCNKCLHSLKLLYNAQKAIDTKEELISQLRKPYAAGNHPTSGETTKRPLDKEQVKAPASQPPPKKLVKIELALAAPPINLRPLLPKPTPTPAKYISVTDKSTQTPIDKDYVYKVVSNRNGKKTTRVVTDETQQKLCQALIHGDGLIGRIARTVHADSAYREAAEKLFIKDIEQQCRYISSDAGQSLLKDKAPENLMTTDFKRILQQWNESGPLYRVLEAAAVPGRDGAAFDPGIHEAVLAFAGSVLLYHRNPTLSRIQYGLGLILNDGGATKEVISLCHKFGICVGLTSLKNKKRLCVKEQKDPTEVLVNDAETEVLNESKTVAVETEVLAYDAETEELVNDVKTEVSIHDAETEVSVNDSETEVHVPVLVLDVKTEVLANDLVTKIKTEVLENDTETEVLEKDRETEVLINDEKEGVDLAIMHLTSTNSNAIEPD